MEILTGPRARGWVSEQRQRSAGSMDDDAAASPLFTYLRTKLPDLLERAVFEGWKVAVPQASSLRGAAISQALVESHLLRQTAIRDEWKTANGRTVVVVKDPGSGSVRLTAGRGFPVQGNTVSVLAEDLWYGPSSDQGLQLVSVSEPLEKDSLSTLNSYATTVLEGEGGLPQNAYLRGGGRATLPSAEVARGDGGDEHRWCEDDKKCLEYIEGIAGSGRPLAELEGRLVEFSRTYIFARNYEGETAEKLRGFAMRFAEETGAPCFDSAYKAALCHTINILESKIWSSLKDIYAEDDMKARSAMSRKLSASCSGAGISEEFQDVDFSEPVSGFRGLDETQSPAMKLFCLQGIQKKTIDAIRKGKNHKGAVTVFGTSQLGSGGSSVVGTDELLPLWIHLVSRAGVENLMTNFVVIKFFSFFSLIGGGEHNNFLVTLMESLVNYFLY